MDKHLDIIFEAETEIITDNWFKEQLSYGSRKSSFCYKSFLLRSCYTLC